MGIYRGREVLPLIPLRGVVVFPYMLLHFDIVRKKSILALENAMSMDQCLFVVAQKDANIENPSVADLYEYGTIVKVKQMLKMPGDVVRVLVEGLERAKVSEVISEKPFYSVIVNSRVEEECSLSDFEKEAFKRQIFESFENFARESGKISVETMNSILQIDNIPQLSDVIAANVLVKFDQKQQILSECDPVSRMIVLVSMLAKEIEIIKVERKISTMVKVQMDKNQRDYFLREQMKAIRTELGDNENIEAEIAEYKAEFEKLNLHEEATKKVEKELEHLRKTQAGSSEAGVIRGYLDLLLELPWNKYTEETKSILNAEKVLEADHFGLEKVKERIIEFLAVRQMADGLKSPILCLVGPPGVGKTSIASSIARALNRKYVRISLGGVRDEADIRGHRKTYVAAMPGRIINALKNVGSSNALVLLDEIDKMGNDFKGDPSSALLEVLDSEQNYSFRDHYVEIPFDLSQIMFVTTANSLESISRPLLDRMEIIEISGYTDVEKFNIAKKYLIPKQRKTHGLKGNQLRIADSAIMDVINYYTRESGVRNLEREIADICRKCAKSIVEGSAKSLSVTPKNLEAILGVKKYIFDKAQLKPQVGVATGLAWTSVGGVTLNVEVNVMDGTGKVELTGQLGDVMKESAMAAISYIRANASKLGVDSSFYKTKDIHIHVPEGATPKDGPSAGITITTALVSALGGRAVLNTVAMTGEVTLRGKVLPIGGLKEKSLAAYRAGIHTVIMPEDNTKDMEEIPDTVLSHMNFIPVKSIDQVLENALQ